MDIEQVTLCECKTEKRSDLFWLVVVWVKVGDIKKETTLEVLQLEMFNNFPKRINLQIMCDINSRLSLKETRNRKMRWFKVKKSWFR